jgi:hypothetical protein
VKIVEYGWKKESMLYINCYMRERGKNMHIYIRIYRQENMAPSDTQPSNGLQKPKLCRRFELAKHLHHKVMVVMAWKVYD